MDVSAGAEKLSDRDCASDNSRPIRVTVPDKPGMLKARHNPMPADSLMSSSRVRYSICTLVTRWDEYEAMAASFRDHGFDGEACEFLFLDNSSGNRFDGYAGLNLFLTVAQGEYVVLCHQDIELLQDGRVELDRIIEDLEQRDPTWAVIGNCGGVAPGRMAIRITDPHGADRRTEDLPVRVSGLDENFVVVRRRANLGLSRDLSGFHLYATDLCQIADVLGWSAYVVDFHLLHKSPGRRDDSLSRARRALIAKYARALRPRWAMSTCELMFLGGPPALAPIMNSTVMDRLLRRIAVQAPGLSRLLFGGPPLKRDNKRS